MDATSSSDGGIANVETAPVGRRARVAGVLRTATGSTGRDSGLGAPATHFRVHVEGQDRAVLLVLAPRFARDAPHDLELVAVRVGAVERLRDAVIGGAP